MNYVNYVILAIYVFFTSSGVVFMKLGGQDKIHALFTIPYINLPISFLSLVGFTLFGCSFVLYNVLINRFDLTYIGPVITGLTYVIGIFLAIIIFREEMTVPKIIGSVLIIAGVFVMNIKIS